MAKSLTIAGGVADVVCDEHKNLIGSLGDGGPRAALIKFLEELNLEPRALGRSDYPAEFPLREVFVIANHCAGGLILGFEQFQATSGTWKRGTKEERKVAPKGSILFPTAWNHLEAGILFGLGLPILIFREDGISGGVFDNGVTDVFVHKMPLTRPSKRR
jgi:hypothetical protein